MAASPGSGLSTVTDEELSAAVLALSDCGEMPAEIEINSDVLSGGRGTKRATKDPSPRPKPVPRKMKPRVKGYVKNVVPLYSDLEFKSYFRLSRSTVEKILEIIPARDHQMGRPSLLATNQEVGVLLTLWTLGNREPFLAVADRFGIGIAQAHGIFTTMCKTLASLRSELITWPTGDEAADVMRKFSSMHDGNCFPDVIGCVDAIHISISAPKKERAHSSYYNRNKFYSVILQAICDSELRFIDVFAGWSGASTDAHVWNNSPIWQFLNDHTEMMPPGAHLLGDPAYPLSVYLMKPFQNDPSLTARQTLFNERLRTTRVVIHQAYSNLFRRFGRLQHIFTHRTDSVATVIVAACVLHNICIELKDEVPDEAEADGALDKCNINFEDEPEILDGEAEGKRDAIADALFRAFQSAY